MLRSDHIAFPVRDAQASLAFSKRSPVKLADWRRKLAAAGIELFEEPDGAVIGITAPPSRPAKRESRAALTRARISLLLLQQ
jgi:hypothetical protein